MKSKKYYNMIRNRVIFLVIMLTIVCISFNASYSNFIYNSNNHRAVEMYISSLQYEFKINDLYTDTITVRPGNTYIKTSITSLNEVNTKFKYAYKSNDNIKVYYVEKFPSDVIKPNETKNYDLLICNLSDDIIKMEFAIRSGYNTNTFEDIKIGEGYTYINDTIRVGDYVDYKPVNSNDSYVLRKELSGYVKDQTLYKKATKWVVLNINNDGSVDLISEKALPIDNRNNLLNLTGYKGYNNGVYILNELCNKIYGSYYAPGRNLNIDDIEQNLTDLWKPNLYVAPGTDNNYVEYNTNTFVPAVYLNHLARSEKGSLIVEDEISEEDNLEINVDYWTQEFEEKNFKNIYFKIFMNQKYSQWLSSRYINSFDSYALFGLSNITNNRVDGNLLYSSINDTFTSSNALRPIVNTKNAIYREKNSLKIKY